MQANSQPSIFQTQPSPPLSAYQRFMNEVKTYTQNLNHHIQNAFNDQNKTIKRKRQQLEKQLQDLRQRFYSERIKLIEIQDHFKKNCQDVIRNDMNKWEQHQNFFSQMLQHYQYQLQIQDLINLRNRQKVQLLKQQLKDCLKNDVKQQVAQRLSSKQSLSKSKVKSKKSHSMKSQSKITELKLKTEASEYTQPTEMNEAIQHRHKLKIKTKKLQTEQNQVSQLPLVSQKILRLKTDMSLPSLKKSTIHNYQQRIQNDDFNFMRPIKTVKKHHQQESIIPQIIKMFQWQKKKILTGQMEPNWFEKVVFNKRNLDKILAHLQIDLQSTVVQKKFPQSGNKVKDLVAKNLFRLKTESSTSKNRSKLKLKEKSLVSVLDRSHQFSQQLIK